MKPKVAASISADNGQKVSVDHGAFYSAGRVPRLAYLKYFKPVLDRILGGALLFVTAPILLLAAIGIRLRLGKPVIYRQVRIGKHGEPFELFKLRTMVTDRRRDSKPYEGPEKRLTHKSPNDPRVLPLGRTLRSWRLDELPQFWNVVNGDMSLVGPRPELPDIVADYEGWQHLRHSVKPGITGLWQISERNGKLMHECVDMDLKYLEKMGLRQDMSILFRTPSAMIGSKKGY